MRTSRKSSSGTTSTQRAVPAVGAYLGEVLVRHLGGQWIPRKKLEEAQVRVGKRVWLPFLRAHRYMRSRQSLLDYSLTHSTAWPSATYMDPGRNPPVSPRLSIDLSYFLVLRGFAPWEGLDGR